MTIDYPKLLVLLIPGIILGFTISGLVALFYTLSVVACVILWVLTLVALDDNDEDFAESIQNIFKWVTNHATIAEWWIILIGTVCISMMSGFIFLGIVWVFIGAALLIAQYAEEKE